MNAARNIRLLDRARRLEARLRIKKEIKKQLKKQRYRIFLQQSPHLPSRRKLYRWRRNFFLAGILCICIPVIQTLWFYETALIKPDPLFFDQEPTLEQIWMSFLNMIPIICGSIALMFSAFGMAVDWVIYRRWGNSFTILNW